MYYNLDDVDTGYIYFLFENHRIFQCCVLGGSILFVVSLCAFQVFVVFFSFPLAFSLWQGLGGESDGTEG